jgi:hypothetical protein
MAGFTGGIDGLTRVLVLREGWSLTWSVVEGVSVKIRCALGAAMLVAVAGTPTRAVAATILPTNFVNPTIINFNDAPDGAAIGTRYAAQGVSFSHLCAGFGPFVDNATNFTLVTATTAGPCEGLNVNPPGDPDALPHAFALFSTPVNLVGFGVITDPDNDLFLEAYKSNGVGGFDLLGFSLFPTGAAATFAGIGFSTPFDLLVIDATFRPDPINGNGFASGAFILDNFTFEAGVNPVPEPASMLLMASGLALGAIVRRRRSRGPLSTT